MDIRPTCKVLFSMLASAIMTLFHIEIQCLLNVSRTAGFVIQPSGFSNSVLGQAGRSSRDFDDFKF